MLNTEQVMALAPDPASAKAGRDLTNRRKWVTLGRQGDAAVWGECQGSGASPYQTQVDLSEPAFKCSCPSRKFPCKHGLGLLLLLASDAPGFVETDAPPDWVVKWLQSRAERTEKQAAKAAEKAEEKPVDAAAQAKRAEKREQRIQDGIDDLDRWMRDTVRAGLANVDLSYKIWDGLAARLIDAQAPGLARMVRDMSGIPSSGSGWQERLVERLGLLYLATQGYRRLAGLPVEARVDLKTLIGWTVPQEEVLAGDGVGDRWTVLGQRVEEEDRLLTQRTWLQGERTGRKALILQFAPASQSFDATGMPPGAGFEAVLAFFPSVYPLRALVKSRDSAPESCTNPLNHLNPVKTPESVVIHGYASAAAIVADYADAVARYPWIDRLPAALDGCVAVFDAGKWQIVDGENTALPIDPKFAQGWRLLAATAGHPTTICGEWNGQTFLPLGATPDGRYISLT